jgi:hypothetical protein
MSDSPEVSYYQSIVNDMSVTVERLNEQLREKREEVVVLRRIVASANVFLASLEENSQLDESECLLDMDRRITDYLNTKKKA